MSKELNLEQVTPQEYSQWLKAEVKAGRLPKSELSVFHVRHENRTFNDVGEKLSVPELQKYDVKDWGSNPSMKQWDYYERMRTGSNDRYVYTILFNPLEKEVPAKEEPETETAEPKEEAEEQTNEQPTAKKPGRKKAEKETINLE